MTKITSTILLIGLLTSSLCAGVINIDMDEFAKLSSPVRNVPQKDSIVELKPIHSGGSALSLDSNQPLFPSGSEKKFSNGNIKEDSRDVLIRNLRASLESGKDFKYYFQNFDYSAYKKDIESMMRDIVSQ